VLRATGIGQLDPSRSTVVRIAPPHHQPGLLQPVWWVIAPFLWALWLALLGTIFLIFRGRSRHWRGDDRAKAIRAERFARGEISAEEFRERPDALR
jgi:putative membrane protein